MSQDNQQLLIDHLDKTLQGEALPEAETLMEQDPQARETFQYLQLAVEAVQHQALHAQVSAVKNQLSREESDSGNNHSIRNLRTTFRIAATVLLIAGVFSIYKYLAVTPASIYKEQFASYELSTTRSSVIAGSMELAYRNGNWAEVVGLYNALNEKTSKDHFLAAMAEMELKQYANAIPKLELVRNANSYFVDEAEYYQALAYLANRQTSEAVALLQKIRADKTHTYYQTARKISALDLKILSMK